MRSFRPRVGPAYALTSTWYRHKEEPSFADILTTLRRLSYEEKIEGALGDRTSGESWIAQLIELLSRTG
jgi:hypothetical protein